MNGRYGRSPGPPELSWVAILLLFAVALLGLGACAAGVVDVARWVGAT